MLIRCSFSPKKSYQTSFEINEWKLFYPRSQRPPPSSFPPSGEPKNYKLGPWNRPPTSAQGMYPPLSIVIGLYYNISPPRPPNLDAQGCQVNFSAYKAYCVFKK